MLLNKQELFSDAQEIPGTLNAATDSTNTLDFRSHGDDIDKELRWFVLLTETATSDGAATLQITWQTSANNSDWTTVYTGSAIALADLTAGSMLVDGAVLPTGLLRYNKLVYKNAGAAFTNTPTVDAGIVRNDMPIGLPTT